MKERRSGPETEKDVPHAVVMGKHTDHNDPARILLIDFRGRNMEFVLQLRCQAFDDHPFFLQAVRPGSVQPEGHGRYVHAFSASCINCSKLSAKRL